LSQRTAAVYDPTFLDALHMATILTVDDDPKVLKLLECLLRADGYEVLAAGDGHVALDTLQRRKVDLLITDIRMHPMDGMQLFRQARERFPQLPVIMLTAYGTVDNASEAQTQGAFDYLTKPFRVDDLTATVTRALENARRREELSALLQDPAGPASRFEGAVVVESPAMLNVCEQVRRVAPTDASVLLTGESGTGKELLASVIHRHSRRRDKPWVVLRCSAWNERTIDAALFGMIEDPFADTPVVRPGGFAAAEGGTLFLDEVSLLPPATQTRLLRVLQEREMRPVGSIAAVPVNVRVVAASDVNLDPLVRARLFSKELYCRLAVFGIEIPPLRERPQDILPLVQFFLHRAGRQGSAVTQISPDAADALLRYPWTGNVRELENALRHAVAFMSGCEITLDGLPPRVVAQARANAAANGADRHRHVFLRAFLQQKQAARAEGATGTVAAAQA
jgi:DNA-binding NtrC family response regulator